MGFFCKKVENGKYFVKSGPFLNAGCNMYGISIFYFTFYLFGGCVRTKRTPLPTGLDSNYAPLPYWRRSSKNVLDEK